MENKKITLLGKYLKSIKVGPSKIEEITGIEAKNVTLLSTLNTKIIYADEFYKIIYAAHYLVGLDDKEFKKAVDYIFPNRVKTKLMNDHANYSPEGRFFKNYTQQQVDIETKLNYSKNQITKYFNAKSKKVLATDIIAFSEAMNLDLLASFKEVYGEIELKDQVKK